MKYALGYRNDKDDLICELFVDWPSMFKRLESMDSIHKTVYEIVKGEDEQSTS